MDKTEIYVDIFRQYCQLKASAKDGALPAEFGWPDSLPQTSTYPIFFNYNSMLREYFREIVNEIVRFDEYSKDISYWAKILARIDDEQIKGICQFENVDPKASLCLLFPKAIQARFIFATAKLSHLVNYRRLGKNWTNVFSDDHQIDYKECNRVGKDWQEYKSLKLKLEKLDNHNSKSNTGDFRNAFSHRFPRRIEFGHLLTLTFHKAHNPRKLSFTIGEQKPFELSEVVAASGEHVKLCVDALNAFKALVSEQISFLTTS